MGLVWWVLPSETHMYRNSNLKSRENWRKTVLITGETLSYKLTPKFLLKTVLYFFLNKYHNPGLKFKHHKGITIKFPSTLPTQGLSPMLLLSVL